MVFFCGCTAEPANSQVKPVSQIPQKVKQQKPKPANYYQEQHRNQLHFSPEANWMNDPNGMVYYDDEYHLFYQYYPDSTVWGPMHWGHAVSEDLVHWEHLPIALYPDELGLIFSGSAVIDHKNTSGFGKDGQPPMVAIFTHHLMAGEKAKTNKFQYQSIAYSNDRGRSWTKYEGNPVVPNPGIKDFRDPKVIWHKESEKWIMVFAAYDKVRIYNSPNLKEWTFQSEFGIPGDQRLWECPDLFPINVEGTNEKKWVLITSIQKEGPNGGTATSYFVGDFDGKNFIGDNSQQYWADYGTDNYAMVTWSDVPESDGRRLAMGWMSNWQYAQVVPTEKWRSAMTLPRSLTLHQEGGKYQLRSNPVMELGNLQKQHIPLRGGNFKAGTKQSLLTDPNHFTYRLDFQFKKPSSSNFALRISNKEGEYVDVGFDGIANEYFVDRRHAGKVDFQKDFAGRHVAPLNYDSETLDLVLFVDKASVELYADEGRTVMTEIFFPNAPLYDFELIIGKGEVDLISSSITKLNGIW